MLRFLLLLLALICVPFTATADTHRRLASQNGPIHVWTPDHYDKSTANLVIYVHGYRTTAAGAWKDHKLANQFEASQCNSMFVVIEAPSSPRQHVNWKDLNELHKYLVNAGLPVPFGGATVLGHSGAYRTIAYWLENTNLTKVLLLDGMYGKFDKYHKFVARQGTQLWMLSVDTLDNAERFIRKERNTVWHLDVSHVYTHNSLVTSGEIIPVFLGVLAESQRAQR